MIAGVAVVRTTGPQSREVNTILDHAYLMPTDISDCMN